MEKLLILACFNDAYFILVQLLNITLYVISSYFPEKKALLLHLISVFSFRSRRFVVDKVYFWFSVVFLIGRTCFLFILCSTISENSRKLIVSLRAIPSAGWNHEVSFCFSVQNV